LTLSTTMSFPLSLLITLGRCEGGRNGRVLSRLNRQLER
jgi:hypothetical protein